MYIPLVADVISVLLRMIYGALENFKQRTDMNWLPFIILGSLQLKC